MSKYDFLVNEANENEGGQQRITCVNVTTLVVEVVNGKKNLIDYAFRNWPEECFIWQLSTLWQSKGDHQQNYTW
jgi:hypothetical protein